MYLYVGSILAIMCIYVSVIVDNCPSITASKENLTKQDDPEVGSITSFGTLKRAHISRSKTSRTSFYLRVGALGKSSQITSYYQQVIKFSLKLNKLITLDAVQRLPRVCYARSG